MSSPALDSSYGSARLRVAVASRDGTALDAHFGSAARFEVYEVTAAGMNFLRTIEASRASEESGVHGAESEDRNSARIAALAGCHLVFVLAIGAPVANKVLRAGIHPIKVADPEPIASVLERVRGFLAGEPPPWLRPVLAKLAPRRSMAFLDDDA